MPRAIVLHHSDNVGTLIDRGSAGESCTLQGENSGSVQLVEDVPFGHKVCVRDTPLGGEILKYGQVIGRASDSLKAGQHVHIHNVESGRGRGDQVKR